MGEPIIKRYAQKYPHLKWYFNGLQNIEEQPHDEKLLLCFDRSSVNFTYFANKDLRSKIALGQSKGTWNWTKRDQYGKLQTTRIVKNMLYFTDFAFLQDRLHCIQNDAIFADELYEPLPNPLRRIILDLDSARADFEELKKIARHYLKFDSFDALWYEVVYISFYGVNTKDAIEDEIAKRVFHDLVLFFSMQKFRLLNFVRHNVQLKKKHEAKRLWEGEPFFEYVTELRDMHIKRYKIAQKENITDTDPFFIYLRDVVKREVIMFVYDIFRKSIVHAKNVRNITDWKKQKAQFDFLTLETMARMPINAQWYINRLKQSSRHTTPQTTVLVLQPDRGTPEFEARSKEITVWYSYENMLFTQTGIFKKPAMRNEYEPFFYSFMTKLLLWGREFQGGDDGPLRIAGKTTTALDELIKLVKEYLRRNS